MKLTKKDKKLTWLSLQIAFVGVLLGILGSLVAQMLLDMAGQNALLGVPYRLIVELTATAGLICCLWMMAKLISLFET
jgi:hypothetical protein